MLETMNNAMMMMALVLLQTQMDVLQPVHCRITLFVQTLAPI